MIKEIRAIINKKGDPMAFAKLEDFEGIIDLTFFTKQWEKYSSLIIPDAVVALTGKIDTSRGAPSFIVDEVLNPMELQEKSISEVHIKIRANMANEQEIQKLLKLKEEGYTLIGLEMTIPELSSLCDLNIDPQHTDQKISQSCVKEICQKRKELLSQFVGKKVIFLTKTPSITSRCITSAP